VPSTEGRGREASITRDDFRHAAAELRAQGKQPTFANLRALLGGISYPVLRRYLDELEAEERRASQLPQELASTATAWFDAAKAAAADQARAELNDAYAALDRERVAMRAAIEEHVAARDKARGLAAHNEGRAEALEVQVDDLKAQRQALEAQLGQAMAERQSTELARRALEREISTLKLATSQQKAEALEAARALEERVRSELAGLVREMLLAKDELREPGRAMARVERAVDRLGQLTEAAPAKQADLIEAVFAGRLDAMGAAVRADRDALRPMLVEVLKGETAALFELLDQRTATLVQAARTDERTRRGRK
jgi:chromosome segregation ATPase